MMKAKISEIFQSIQGEGKYTGVRQVFVRFFGCETKCVWCDTPYAMDEASYEYQELDCKELFSQVHPIWDRCHSVSLTGGEPLLQKDFLKEFLPVIQKARMPSYLDTNGIYYEALEEIIDHIDMVAMDIKMPSSTKRESFWDQHKRFLEVALQRDVFIKTVVTQETIKEDIVTTVELLADKAPDILLVLQPESRELSEGLMTRCLEYQNYCLKYLSNVRIMPQMHKLMGL